MVDSVRWRVVLVQPGEEEVALLAELSSRGDAEIIGVVDPTREALGTAIAEVMGLPIAGDWRPKSLHAGGYAVFPVGSLPAEKLAGEAMAHGLKPLSSQDFSRLLAGQTVRRKRGPERPRHFEVLEREAETVNRTLSRIEEALQRESLLRWLLSLATRSVQSTSGSIMLLDDNTQELFIAFAYGLSDSVQHRARVKLGEGIAGRVALARRSELVVGRQEGFTGEGRDRPDIAASICAPLTWEDQLLGVLNVSVARGDPDLGKDDLATIERLARRIGLILHRFLGLQEAHTSEVFHRTDRQLQEILGDTEDLPTVLSAWAGALALDLAAVRCSLAVVCRDGSLLVAEGRQDGETAVWYETTENQAWHEVRETGSPLVVRQSDEVTAQDGGQTVFYLPVGHDPVLAILTAVFASAAEAHHFHTVSSEVLFLLEKRVSELIRRAGQQDQLKRLSELTVALADVVTAGEGSEVSLSQRVCDAASSLTGAQRVYLVTEVTGGLARLSGGEPIGDEALLRQIGRLMGEVGDQRWRLTLLSDSSDPHLKETCLLAVPAATPAPAPGLLLWGKTRLHPLDGAVFTDFDGELVRRLACLLLPPCRPAETSAETTVASPRPPAPPDLAEAEPRVPPAPGGPISQTQHQILTEVLRREMDRCDRYHTTFALSALRPLAPGWDLKAARELQGQLGPNVRSSDVLLCHEDGTVLIVVPEDVQAIPRQQKRLVALIRQLTGNSNLEIATASNVYPGRHDDPDQLLADTLATLA